MFGISTLELLQKQPSILAAGPAILFHEAHKRYNCGNMTGKILASCLLLTAAAACQSTTVELNGGLQAQIISMGRDRGSLTVAVKITNTGKDHAFMLLFGEPSAFDDAGGRFSIVRGVTGVAYCPGPQTNPPSTRLCVGLPRVDGNLFPLQGYTEIDPGKSVIAHFSFNGGGDKGEHISLSAEMAYRFVKEADLAQDADVPDQRKLKTLRFGTLSFEPVSPAQIK